MLFTSEQVSAGHPDKICDQISDAVVTDCLKHDRNSRVAVEAMIKVYVAGEITSKHEPNIKYLVRNVLLSAQPDLYDTVQVETQISKQSGDIALGVDKKGAGDQGIGHDVRLRHEGNRENAPSALRAGDGSHRRAGHQAASRSLA